MKNIKDVLQKNKNKLLRKKNVVAVGIGNKWTGGKNTGVPALLVFVVKKVTTAKLAGGDLIPKTIGQYKTDVVGRTGVIKAHALTSRTRPLKAGYSYGHRGVTAGTLGGWFIDKNGDVVGLSNNHVLANTNRTWKWAVILQPGKHDSRNWRANRVGRLKRYVRLRRLRVNYQDSAIFKPGRSKPVDFILESVGVIKGFNDDIKVGDKVQKLGRTTSHTTGNVIAVDVTVLVKYSRWRRSLKFRDQIITDNMCDYGDSGSLLCDMDSNVTGLLFAGSDTITVHNKIMYPRERYGLKVFTPLSQTLSHTVLVDGVEADYVLNKIGDVPKLVSRLKKVASSGKVVDLSISYKVE